LTFSPSDSGLFPLLKRVSRSFYLSIRFLPVRIRPAIAIGYLLARASDTIADTNKFEPAFRLETLDSVLTALQGRTIDLAQRVSLCVDVQPSGAEKELLKQLMSLVAYAGRLVPSHQVLLLEVLSKIVRGQRLDIERFEMADSLHSLRNSEELEEYAYLVAGSVGEFWTRLCALEWASYSRIPKADLERLGTEFGKGLQLVNILRDFPADIAQGRSYLPVDDPRRLKENAEIARPLFLVWHGRTWHYLQSAWAYVRAVRPIRVRFACALPVLIGARTLRKLDGPHLIGAKISRLEVYWLMMLSSITAFLPFAAKPIGSKFGLIDANKSN
jgi:farnesyl-diphosphate farnesyltransferase